MAYCSNCGAAIEPNSTFCSSCGAPVVPSAGSGPPQAIPLSTPYNSGQPSPEFVQRPAGVTILAVLAGLAGLATISFGLIFTLFGFGFVFVLIGFIQFAVAYGFWTGASWGWWLGIIGAALNVLSIFTFNVIGFVIGIIFLYYLTRPYVKAWFHET